jgi:hypothetical protein
MSATRSSGPRPGPVAAVHRILIVTALVATLFYAAWEARSGETLGLVRAALAFGVSIGFAVYLRRLRGLGAKLTPRD